MTSSDRKPSYRVAVISMVKHDYISKGIFSHERFIPVVVTDDADQPDWVHERNQQQAAQIQVPYVPGIEAAVKEFEADVAIVSSAAERHCDLTVRAAELGLHVVQDKPMSTKLAECDRAVDAIERNNVRFLLWNRNALPAVRQAIDVVKSGELGRVIAVHLDFYFAKDAGPPKGTRGPEMPPMDWLEALKAAHVTGADGGVGQRPMGELEVEGIYPLAYLHALIPERVVRVFAHTTSHFHQLHADNNVDDLATVTLELEGGAIATLSIGRIGNASHPELGEIKIRAVGEQGTLVVSEPRPEVAVYHRGQTRSDFPHQLIANDNDWLLADEFANAIDDQRPTCLDVRVGRAICATVHAAIESGRSGIPVEIEHRDPQTAMNHEGPIR